MQTFTFYVALVALLGFAASTLANTITWQPCPNSNGDSAADCTVESLRIHPCIGNLDAGICNLKRGRNASFSFDFTPKFSGADLQANILLTHQEVQDTLVDSDTNPCRWTSCPLVSGHSQTYKYTHLIPEHIYPGMFSVIAQLRNTDNKSCCFMFMMNILE